MQIIPAIYIKEGKVAAYTPGNYDNISFLDVDPYELVERLGKLNLERIYIVDVDASLPGPENNVGLLGSLCNTTVPDLEVGGGLDNLDYIKSLQYAGVDYFVLGTVVIDDFEFVRSLGTKDKLKKDHILISADVSDGKLTYQGWTKEVPNLGLDELIWKCLNIGFERFIISETYSAEANGPNIDFYQTLVKQFPGAQISASGNISTIDHVKLLAEVGIKEAVMGVQNYSREGMIAQINAYNSENR